jgi:hypothetical protein
MSVYGTELSATGHYAGALLWVVSGGSPSTPFPLLPRQHGTPYLPRRVKADGAFFCELARPGRGESGRAQSRSARGVIGGTPSEFFCRGTSHPGSPVNASEPPGSLDGLFLAPKSLLEQYHDDGGHGEDNPPRCQSSGRESIVIHLRPHCSSAKGITPQQRGAKSPDILTLVLLWSARA